MHNSTFAVTRSQLFNSKKVTELYPRHQSIPSFSQDFTRARTKLTTEPLKQHEQPDNPTPTIAFSPNCLQQLKHTQLQQTNLETKSKRKQKHQQKSDD